MIEEFLVALEGPVRFISGEMVGINLPTDEGLWPFFRNTLPKGLRYLGSIANLKSFLLSHGFKVTIASDNAVTLQRLLVFVPPLLKGPGGGDQGQEGQGQGGDQSGSGGSGIEGVSIPTEVLLFLAFLGFCFACLAVVQLKRRVLVG